MKMIQAYLTMKKVESLAKDICKDRNEIVLHQVERHLADGKAKTWEDQEGFGSLTLRAKKVKTKTYTKEEQEQIDALQKQIDALQARIDALGTETVQEGVVLVAKPSTKAELTAYELLAQPLEGLDSKTFLKAASKQLNIR